MISNKKNILYDIMTFLPMKDVLVTAQMDKRTYLGDNILKNFGMSTMMANYLQWFCFKNKIKKLTLEDFAKKVFPFGVPKDEVWEEMWSLQKVKTENCMIDSDNGLDHQELMKSIINITK